MRIISVVQIAAVILLTGCSASQITRTEQNRPTTPPAPTVRADVRDGVIPSGTELAIRVNETIETQNAGGVYQGEVAQAVQDSSGGTVIPVGARAELAVVQARSGGEVGTRTIELALQSVTVNGQRRTAESEGRVEGGPAGLGTNRRTAEMVGGGAVLGAVVGAVIGGGRGAAVGAAVGAAGGAATQVLTRGELVRIPAETVMTFRLAAPLRIQ